MSRASFWWSAGGMFSANRETAAARNIGSARSIAVIVDSHPTFVECSLRRKAGKTAGEKRPPYMQMFAKHVGQALRPGLPCGEFGPTGFLLCAGIGGARAPLLHPTPDISPPTRVTQ